MRYLVCVFVSFMLACSFTGIDISVESTAEAEQELGLPGQCSVICDDGNDCTVDACSATGTGCIHTSRPSGSACVDEDRDCAGTCFAPYTAPGGVVYAGECGCNACDGCVLYHPPQVSNLDSTMCGGCMDILGLCRPGTTPRSCGNPDSGCVSCDDGNECTDDVCVVFTAPGYPQCGYYMLNNEHLCNAGLLPGRCDGNGGCCPGCFSFASGSAECVPVCPSGKACDYENGMCFQ